MKRRIFPLVGFVLAIVLCYIYAQTRGQFPEWWRNHAGGILYVLMGIMLSYVAFPKPKWILSICIGVVFIASALEVLQLWDFEPLTTLRKFKVGAALFGTVFRWPDFPPYVIGGVIGYITLRLIPGEEVRS